MKIPGSKGFKATMAVIFGSISAIVLTVIVINLVDRSSTTDEEIQEQFCRTGTQLAIGLPQDEYCSNPDLYRQHMENPSECLANTCGAL